MEINKMGNMVQLIAKIIEIYMGNIQTKSKIKIKIIPEPPPVIGYY